MTCPSFLVVCVNATVPLTGAVALSPRQRGHWNILQKRTAGLDLVCLLSYWNFISIKCLLSVCCGRIALRSVTYHCYPCETSG